MAVDVRPPLVALDLSLTATGCAGVPSVDEPVSLRTVSSSFKGVERLCDLLDGVLAFVEFHDPVLTVVEDLVHAARGSSAGPLGMLHGAVRVALHRSGIEMAFVPPASLKKYATGRGNATKPDMRMALYQRAGLDLRDDNQVDAWWLAAMAADAAGVPLVSVPAAQRAALEKVEWPEGWCS
jgi:Holliday junction resolvasome RuvABC endonuclease subunit